MRLPNMAVLYLLIQTEKWRRNEKKKNPVAAAGFFTVKRRKKRYIFTCLMSANSK
jgi:hypothetical protein